MKLQTVKNNVNVISTDNADILFSYSTPVAACVNGKFIRTATHYSVTTSKHINQWLAGRKAETVEQSVIDNLLKGA